MGRKRLLFGCKKEVTVDLQGLFTNICGHLIRPNDIQNLAATKVYYATGTRRSYSIDTFRHFTTLHFFEAIARIEQ
jgi:hypothetical protein